MCTQSIHKSKTETTLVILSRKGFNTGRLVFMTLLERLRRVRAAPFQVGTCKKQLCGGGNSPTGLSTPGPGLGFRPLALEAAKAKGQTFRHLGIAHTEWLLRRLYLRVPTDASVWALLFCQFWCFMKMIGFNILVMFLVTVSLPAHQRVSLSRGLADIFCQGPARTCSGLWGPVLYHSH